MELHQEAVSHFHLQVNPLGKGRPALSPLISHQSLSESEDQGTLLCGGLTSDSYIGVLNTWRAC